MPEEKLYIDEYQLLEILRRHKGCRLVKDCQTNFSLACPATYTKAAIERKFAHAEYGLAKKNLISRIERNGQEYLVTAEFLELEANLVKCECECEYQRKMYSECPECGRAN